MKLHIDNYSYNSGFKFIQHKNIKDSSVICLEELINNLENCINYIQIFKR